MRILYLDIDCLRPDHLGCYGYHRDTSPHIDRLAARGLRGEAVYVSDAPCLPSRTALFSGRFGIHTGVVGHGGAGAEMFPDGPSRGFGSLLGRTGWMRCLRDAGYFTASISPFAERHAAWHFAAGWNELHNPGRRGLECADEIAAVALDWLRRRGRDERWFLHVNFWDPHTPYRAPPAFGDPFAAAPLPAWLSEEVRQAHWAGVGPGSAREVVGFDAEPARYPAGYPRQPLAIDSAAALRQCIDGYDTGVRYADEHVGQLLAALDTLGVLDGTAVIVSADHGENLGELNIYGDHQTADEFTCRVPWILVWPGLTDRCAGGVLGGLHYQVDLAAALVELCGGQVPESWDGVSCAGALRGDAVGPVGRPYLVLSQGAWTCQRAVRFREAGGEYLCIRSYHDGYHGFPDVMLYELASDPHEQRDLAAERPALVATAMAHLADWQAAMMRTSRHGRDPLWTVLAEGGPAHVRGQLPAYLQRLRRTGRAHWADRLEAREREA